MLLTENKLPETGFLRIKQVLVIVPVSRSTWWAGIQAGRYPQPVKIGLRATAWRVEDIRALVEKLSNQGAESTQGANHHG